MIAAAFRPTIQRMTLTSSAIFASAGLDPKDAMVIRHAYVRESGNLHADSTDVDILEYTRVQSSNPRIFPATPPSYWVVFRPEGGDRARLWAVLRHHDEEACDDPSRRVFNLEVIDLLDDLRDQLGIGWRSPRTWWIWGTTAAAYPIMEIADSEPIRFPGFDALTLDYPQLQAVSGNIATRLGGRLSRRSSVSTSSPTPATAGTTSERPTVRRTFSNGGRGTRPTATGAMSNYATSTRRPFVCRSSGFSIQRHRRWRSTLPKDTSSTRSTLDDTD